MLLKSDSTILRAFINKQIRNLPLLIIILLGLIFRLYKIDQAFQFDFDQETAANSAYDFFVNHKITLVGQELSFEGFFLGPLHNWIQLIPYKVCSLMPDCVPYFYIGLGVISIAVFYFVTKKIFDDKSALIASAVYSFSFLAISYERGVNSNYFLFLSSIAMLFALFKYFQFHDKYLIFGALACGIATVNFNPVFIFSSIAFFIFALVREKRGFLVFLTACFAFLINYFPLVIFNFRHDQILIKSLQNFINQNTATSDYAWKIVFLLKNILVPFYSYYLFQSAGFILELVVIFLILFGVYQLFKNPENKFVFFLPFWILIVFAGFIFYKGHIPDYYFQQSLLPFIIIIAFALKKRIVLFLPFAALFLFANIYRVLDYHSVINYKIKKDIVNYIIGDSNKETFNIYYDMPKGLNTGYSYLFKAKNQMPVEGAKNLYILEVIDPGRFETYKYYKAFPDKNIAIDNIGFVYVISVK